MSDLASAQIIPFPTRALAPLASPEPTPYGLGLAPPANPDAERLGRALAALDAALAEQREAVAAWRAALAALRDLSHGLGAGLARLNAGLDMLGGDVATLNGRARALEDWADDALARAPG